MPIFKKERTWSEKLVSAELPVPEVQRGTIALRRRSITGFVIPTTIEKVHTVVLTPLNTTARTTLKGGWLASNTKVNYNAVVGGVSAFKLIPYLTTAAARVEDELVYDRTTKKLYQMTRDLAATSAGASVGSLTTAITNGAVVELKSFATGAAVFIPFTIAASAAASAAASIARYAFEVRGWKA